MSGPKLVHLDSVVEYHTLSLFYLGLQTSIVSATPSLPTKISI